MEILVGDDFELTDAIKEEVHQRIEQVESHLPKKGDARVHLQMSGGIFHVQFHYSFSKANVVASAEDRDFHRALNEAKQKLQRQLDDFVKKRRKRRSA